jgi:hypothetical protein
MGSVSSSRGYLSGIVGISSSEGIDVKCMYSAEFPQDEVKLIRATALVYRVAMEEEGDGERSENDMAWEHLLEPVIFCCSFFFSSRNQKEKNKIHCLCNFSIHVTKGNAEC